MTERPAAPCFDLSRRAGRPRRGGRGVTCGDDIGGGHGSLETFGGPQRHAIAHLKAGKMEIPNMSSVMLGKSVLFLKFQYLHNIRNYFFLAGFKASSQSVNAKYLLRTCSQHAGEQSCCSKY